MIAPVEACGSVGPSVVQHIKLWLVCETTLPKDALHVYVGVLVLLSAAAVMRRKVGSLWPLSVVAAVALAGEVVDVIDQLRVLDPFVRWGDSVHDLLNTLALPVLLTLVARWSGLLGGDGGQ